MRRCAPTAAVEPGGDRFSAPADLARAVVTKVWSYGRGGKPMLDKLDRGTLADHVAVTEVGPDRTLDLVGAR